MALDLAPQVREIFRKAWETRQGRVVPEPGDLKLGNDAVEFTRATVLYADLSGSTALVDTSLWQFAAEIYKAYLHCAASIIRNEGGVITSYDGDRVMGVFVGDNQTTPAARAALKINWAVQKIVNPELKAQYPTSNYAVSQVVGIDCGEVRAARTGVRGFNDIVWVGRPANYAAKLTELKGAERSWITDTAYGWLHDDLKRRKSDGVPMWKKFNWTQNGNKPVWGSTWTWSL